jgi:hypothetical protein
MAESLVGLRIITHYIVRHEIEQLDQYLVYSNFFLRLVWYIAYVCTLFENVYREGPGPCSL